METAVAPADAGALEQLTVTIGGHHHSALAAGPASGELVLLLHGWPEFADAWTEQLHALGEAGYRALAVDQRGYAAGARPDGVEHYTLEHLVGDALAFADSQGADRFHLVARDWGGMVAWALAAAHPDRLRSLTVLSTPHPAALQRAVATDDGQSHDLGYIRFFRREAGKAEKYLLRDEAAQLRAVYSRRIPEAIVERAVTRLSEPGALTATLNWYRGATNDEFDIPAGRIKVPTLYLWGREDPYLGQSAAEQTVHHIDAEYRFQIIEGASQWMAMEVPDEVSALLLDHFQRH
ncbi:alpha/beta hydrolase [Amycolatopsis mediterranei S699]|uniref:Alpha/beta hydrolase n=2 Tax=Amycolatopsis mediterranei TaxID=33910 RepID=A0A0H3D425_AMYMU|nr:alpha/beta hydrolase [Amycolatopsis mediterranei]ADJ44927.1 alpha/beta hydrolase [Amycolatopsis mediterranei U32]AEK41677.1 alpha/beta hydrolase [Amycolatopsis mediterranei S699]AFO76638.1 alpha/beta hydrolase [Amycolatopsis mediterranei S699]AGT83767.1 alpha/beta hydrolase [Amycolatopsis mediterranei RB]KDO07248.1 haloalkane dehalogenase [Amycolatopsis mediterranei]